MPLVLPQSPPPWVSTDRPCYVEDRPVEVRGGGFAAGVPVRIAREGMPVATAPAAADGSLDTTISSGRLPRGVAERVSELTADDGTATATQRFRVTRFDAAFSPRAASPRTFVRFSAFGFGAGQTVYVHYVAPGGGTARTVRLGRAPGPCGSIRRTKPRRLFPFRPRRGIWRLQFDTARTRRPDAVPRLVLPVRVAR